ncbi:ribosome maturation factor RimM [Cryptosporangium aurantiacum]|uniref:Ribosome maturation factor RimM n=1 Tax=Cryptosporangium aurantiacum TaxID=134849 RepID=A0A1M7HVW9_9ACTN|nr:ribosome maturation factor RimM [Cryptosporangium aurantiacum]SHM32539.1 16S rRNA processing protein RimM [Cryptosporangium aurantiacum]
MLLVVGRIGRAHGIRGDVLVEVRTDEPDERFAAGSVLVTDPADAGPLTVADARWHSGKLVVRFEGVQDRNGAEKIRGLNLVVDSEDLPPSDDPDEFHDYELVGLTAVGTDGAEFGSVVDVIHSAAGEILVLSFDGSERLVPFVREIVPTVDVPGGRVVIVPPEGLFDL